MSLFNCDYEHPNDIIMMLHTKTTRQMLAIPLQFDYSFVTFYILFFSRLFPLTVFQLVSVAEIRILLTENRITLTTTKIPLTKIRIPLNEFRIPIIEIEIPLTEIRILSNWNKNSSNWN